MTCSWLRRRGRGASVARFWMQPETTAWPPVRNGWSYRRRPRTVRPGRCTNRTGISRTRCSWYTNWSFSAEPLAPADGGRDPGFAEFTALGAAAAAELVVSGLEVRMPTLSYCCTEDH